MTADPTASALCPLRHDLPDLRVSKAALNSATGPSHHAGACSRGPNQRPAQSRVAMAAVTTLPDPARPRGTAPQAVADLNPRCSAQQRIRQGPPDFAQTRLPA